LKNKIKIFLLFIFSFYIVQYYSQDSISFTTANSEFQTGNYTAALKSFLIAKKSSKEKDINYLIGIIYFNLKKYPEAIMFFSEELKKNKNNLNAYVQRAQSYKLTGKYKLASKDLDKVIQINKEYFLAFYEKGNLKYDQKEFKPAIENYNKAVSIRPNFEKAFYKIGYCYLNLKDTIEACKNWKKIEDLDDFENYQEIEALIKFASQKNQL